MAGEKIPFDAFVLAAVAWELQQCVVPSKVQKVQQPSPTDLVLHLYSGAGGAHKLLLTADPASARVHLTQIKRDNPQNPLAFCQVCRKYLDGAVLEAVEQPVFDRVLRLTFRGSDGEKVWLVAELMGRNSNLVLVSGTNLVRGTLRPVPSGNERVLRPGAVYADPPGLHDKRDPLTVAGAGDAVWGGLPPDTGAAKTWLSSTFGGLGRFAETELLARAENHVSRLPAVFAELMGDVKAERFVPNAVVDENENPVGVWAFAPQSVPPQRRLEQSSVSVALETVVAARTENADQSGEKASLRRLLARETAFREKELRGAQTTLAESDKADEYERAGNNLLAQLAGVKKGDANVTLADLYDVDGAEITLTLDPKKSPQENAQAYFTRAGKARDARDYAESRAREMQAELDQLARLERDLEAAENAEDFDALRQKLAVIAGQERAAASPAANATKKTAEKPWGGHKIRAFTVDGYELLIGETAEANDYLTTRLAQPADWWMHVRSAPGAHGVLRTHNQPQRVPEAVLRQAAGIVAARSGTAIKHSDTVAVDIVEKRHVRKPRGAKAGAVTYQRERVIDVTPAL